MFENNFTLSRLVLAQLDSLVGIFRSLRVCKAWQRAFAEEVDNRDLFKRLFEQWCCELSTVWNYVPPPVSGTNGSHVLHLYLDGDKRRHIHCFPFAFLLEGVTILPLIESSSTSTTMARTETTSHSLALQSKEPPKRISLYTVASSSVSLNAGEVKKTYLLKNVRLGRHENQVQDKNSETQQWRQQGGEGSGEGSGKRSGERSGARSDRGQWGLSFQLSQRIESLTVLCVEFGTEWEPTTGLNGDVNTCTDGLHKPSRKRFLDDFQNEFSKENNENNNTKNTTDCNEECKEENTPDTVRMFHTCAIQIDLDIDME